MGDLDSIPGLGRSPEEGKGYPLQDSGLENSMDWNEQLSNFHFGESKWCNAFCISTAGYTVEELRKK